MVSTLEQQGKIATAFAPTHGRPQRMYKLSEHRYKNADRLDLSKNMQGQRTKTLALRLSRRMFLPVTSSFHRAALIEFFSDKFLRIPEFSDR